MTPPKKKPDPKKKPKGRPRITRDVLDARIADYCDRYDVRPTDTGLPPFPSGKRESPQHREWLGLYKAHSRLASRGEVHSEEARRAKLQEYEGRCPLCDRAVDLETGVNDSDSNGDLRGLLHKECRQIVAWAERHGPASPERLRAYLFD